MKFIWMGASGVPAWNTGSKKGYAVTGLEKSVDREKKMSDWSSR